MELVIRHLGRRKRVIILGRYLERLSAEQRDAAERALRVWDALPIAPYRD